MMNDEIDRSDELLELIAEDECRERAIRNGQHPDDPGPIESIEPPDDTPSSLLAGMVDGAWLDAQEFPPLRWAVQGIVPEGFGLLVGPPKLGKSWFVAGVGLGCAAGGSALGCIKVDQRPVLYLALEDGHRRLQDRFRRITGGKPIPADIHVITVAKRHEVLPMIAEFLGRHDGELPLIILDTLGKVKPHKQAGEESYALDYAIGGQLKAVIDQVPGAALLVVHHTRKLDSADFVDSVSGTQGLAGAADYVLVLKRQRHSADATLAVTGRDVPEAEYALRVNQGMSWRLDGTDLANAAQAVRMRAETARLGDRALEVLAFVNGREQTTTPAQVAAEIGITAKRAGESLARLAEAGRIRKKGRGSYAPISPAETADSAENAGQVVIYFPQPSAETDTGVEKSADKKTPSDQPLPHFPHIGEETGSDDEPDAEPPRCESCPAELETPESVAAGQCAECRLIANNRTTSGAWPAGEEQP
jgi:hypothetical protein